MKNFLISLVLTVVSITSFASSANKKAALEKCRQVAIAEAMKDNPKGVNPDGIPYAEFYHVIESFSEQTGAFLTEQELKKGYVYASVTMGVQENDGNVYSTGMPYAFLMKPQNTKSSKKPLSCIILENR